LTDLFDDALHAYGCVEVADLEGVQDEQERTGAKFVSSPNMTSPILTLHK
jgi:hypothetical protein